MSEMTSVVEQHQHRQQQYNVSGSNGSGEKLHCKDCGMNFDSSSSLAVHLRYHQENLLSQWASQASQEESNNNNSKAGNHNSDGDISRVCSSPLKHDSVTAAADSSESTSRLSSDAALSSNSGRAQQSQERSQQDYNQHFSLPMFNDSQYFMQSEPNYVLPHHYSPEKEEDKPAAHEQSRAAANYMRYHPYPRSHYAAERANSVSSTSPSSPLQCDKCCAVFESANHLAEHVTASHPTSPNVFAAQSAQSQSQQQQIHSQQQQQQQQMHAASPQAQTNHHPQQSGYDYVGGIVKSEVKLEPEEQAEILDLDSHKVQTHRYEEEFLRLQQQHQQEVQLQMQQQVMQQHQSRGSIHSVNSMLSWPPPAQTHDYRPTMPPVGSLESGSPIQEQHNQFMRGQQHLASVESAHHRSSPIITSTQSIPGHPLSSGLIQQNPKPPPLGNQSWKSNEARRPKTYNCTACNKWFTSSGHLKRHYNTTLHKNAVKQSNQPDPANMPISAHHHPGRDLNRAPSANRNSPELSVSSSPPNLMAGPSNEATGDLLHTPTTTAATFSNSNSSTRDNSSEATSVQATLHHKSQDLQAQQQQSLTSMLASNEMFGGSLASQTQPHRHQHQPMNSTSPQLGHQPQNQHSHSMHSPVQITGSAQHLMNSPLSPLQQHQSHMNTLSPVSVNHHHHINSPSLIMAGMAPTAMASSPTPVSMMDSTMPPQPYPNALPPHVTTITSIPGLLESITNQLTTSGNSNIHALSIRNQQQQHDVLPGFGIFNNSHQHYQQKPLPSFSQFNINNEYMMNQNQSQVINVGGLSSEENVPPQERSLESPVSNYDFYRNSPTRYECTNGMDMMQTNEGPIIVSTYSELQRQEIIMNHHHQQQQQQQQSPQQSPEQSPQHQPTQQPELHQLQEKSTLETNNNISHTTAKEEVNPNIVNERITVKEEKTEGTMVTKEHQVTSTNTGSHYISENGLHKCIECDKIFNKACYLTQHNKSFHSGDKPFKCNQCGKRFPHEYLHAEHLQKHAGDKPYKCEICPKQFNHKTDLRRHLCLHTGEKPYACDTCGKGFIRKDHMMKHLETHKKKPSNHHKVHLRA